MILALIANGLPELARAQAKADSSGPSLAETVRWLMSEAPPMLVSRHEEYAGRGHTDLTSSRVDSLRVEACALSWVSIDTLIRYMPISPLRAFTRESIVVPLGSVDVRGVAVETYARDTTYRVRVPARATAGRVIRHHSEQGDTLMTLATLPVETSESGTRVAMALKRAALLCGAPASPF